MSEIDNTPATYVAYNEAIGMLVVLNKQCNEETQAMCNVAVLGLLSKVYYIKDVYHRVLQYMIDNDMYEKFITPILELQFCPPPKEEQAQTQSSNENIKQDKEENKGSGNVQTKTNKNKDINEMFIRRLYNDEE